PRCRPCAWWAGSSPCCARPRWWTPTRACARRTTIGVNGVASTSLPHEHPASGPLVITLRGVRKHYGALHAVDGVDLDIPAGEIFGLIGHNGAGKSTLFKMMLGLVAPTAGDIRVAGAP